MILGRFCSRGRISSSRTYLDLAWNLDSFRSTSIRKGGKKHFPIGSLGETEKLRTGSSHRRTRAGNLTIESGPMTGLREH